MINYNIIVVSPSQGTWPYILVRVILNGLYKTSYLFAVKIELSIYKNKKNE